MQDGIRNAEAAGSEKVVHSEEIASRRMQPIALLAVLGVAGHAFSTAIAWLLPLASEYTLVGDNISELAIGRHGYLQTAAFLAAGVGSLALAVGVRRTTNGAWGSRVGSLLIGVFGVGPILAAIFPTDRIDVPADLTSLTVVGTVHVAVALIAFVCGIASMFVLSRTFKRDARWRVFWPASLALALTALVVFFLQGEGPWVGLYQRMLVGTITLWLILVAFRLFSIARGTSARHPARGKGAPMSELPFPARPRPGPLRPRGGCPVRAWHPEDRVKAKDDDVPPAGLRRAGLGRAGLRLLVGLAAPVALYYGLRAAGVGAYPALIAGAVAPALGAAVGLVRGRRIDGLMAFFTAMTLLSLGVSLVGGSPRFLLAREGGITGAAGVWFLASAWTARPLALVFSRPLLEGLFRYAPGRWDGLWEREPRFRRVWRVSSVVFGLGTLADSAARVAMAYTLPVDLVPALGTALYATTSVVLLVIVNVYYARSGLWIMLRVGPYQPPANPTVRRLLYPVHKMLSGRGSRVRQGPQRAVHREDARGGSEQAHP